MLPDSVPTNIIMLPNFIPAYFTVPLIPVGGVVGVAVGGTGVGVGGNGVAVGGDTGIAVGGDTRVAVGSGVWDSVGVGAGWQPDRAKHKILVTIMILFILNSFPFWCDSVVQKRANGMASRSFAQHILPVGISSPQGIASPKATLYPRSTHRVKWYH
jgi:hypothetical protein